MLRCRSPDAGLGAVSPALVQLVARLPMQPGEAHPAATAERMPAYKAMARWLWDEPQGPGNQQRVPAEHSAAWQRLAASQPILPEQVRGGAPVAQDTCTGGDDDRVGAGAVYKLDRQFAGGAFGEVWRAVRQHGPTMGAHEAGVLYRAYCTAHRKRGTGLPESRGCALQHSAWVYLDCHD